MASTLEKVTQERNDKNNSQGRSNKASYLNNDAELRKIFGLTKDLSVCLTRIPHHLGSGGGFDSFSCLVKSDTYKETEFIVKEEGRKQVIDFKVSFVGTPKIYECINFLDFFLVLCINMNDSCYQICMYMYYTKTMLRRTIYAQVKMHPQLIKNVALGNSLPI